MTAPKLSEDLQGVCRFLTEPLLDKVKQRGQVESEIETEDGRVCDLGENVTLS